MALARPSSMRNISERKTWVKPYLQVSVQGIASDLWHECEAGMSLITFDLMQLVREDWPLEIICFCQDRYCYKTANSDIKIWGQIVIPVTITHVFEPFTLMIQFAIIERHETSMMDMGAMPFRHKRQTAIWGNLYLQVPR